MQCYAALGVQAYPCWGPSTPFPLFRWPRGPCSCRVLGLHHPSAVLPATPAPHRPPEPHLRPVPWQQRAPGPGSQRSPREGSRAQTGEGGAAGTDKQTFCSPGCCQPGSAPGWGGGRTQNGFSEPSGQGAGGPRLCGLTHQHAAFPQQPRVHTSGGAAS